MLEPLTGRMDLIVKIAVTAFAAALAGAGAVIAANWKYKPTIHKVQEMIELAVDRSETAIYLEVRRDYDDIKAALGKLETGMQATLKQQHEDHVRMVAQAIQDDLERDHAKFASVESVSAQSMKMVELNVQLAGLTRRMEEKFQELASVQLERHTTNQKTLEDILKAVEPRRR